MRGLCRLVAVSSLASLVFGACAYARIGHDVAIELTAPPSPAASTAAFGRWLHDSYGNVRGYWTCPLGQTYGQEVACLAEVRVGQTWHLTSATATLSGGRVVFPKNSDQSWVRRWSPYARHYLVRGGGFTVPGIISVNSPSFDWAWLALGARANWKHRREFHLDGYDGQGKGLMRFFDFACSVQQNAVSCHNTFGDAMRYIAIT